MAERPVPPTPQPPTPQPPAPQRPVLPHVLVVDDEVIATMALERFLSRKGFRVSSAGDGLSALAIDAADPVDLVVTDLRMPRCDGRELVRRLWLNRPNLPVVLMTGYLAATDETALAGGGPIEVMAKPVDIEQLLATLRRFSAAQSP